MKKTLIAIIVSAGIICSLSYGQESELHVTDSLGLEEGLTLEETEADTEIIVTEQTIGEAEYQSQENEVPTKAYFEPEEDLDIIPQKKKQPQPRTKKKQLKKVEKPVEVKNDDSSLTVGIARLFSGILVTSIILLCLAFFFLKAPISTGLKPGTKLKSLFDKGALKTVDHYKKSQLDGLYKQYFENGRLKQQVKYKKGKKNGMSEQYYDNGQLYLKENFKDDKIHGVSQSFYSTGGLWKESHYENGALQGAQKIYHEKSGQLKEELIYQDNKRNGFRTLYYDNGRVKRKENYKDDVLKSGVQGYYENGTVKYERKIDKGDKEEDSIVIYKIYNKDGSIKKRMLFKNNRQEGAIMTYYEDGKLKEEIAYKAGKRASAKKYDKNGRIIFEKKGEEKV